MSRIGSTPIIIPNNVTAQLNSNELFFCNGKNSLSFVLKKGLSCVINDRTLTLTVSDRTSKSKAFWGTYRSIINNIVKGLSKNFFQCLDMSGVGYKAEADDKYLTLYLGFSHIIKYKIPEGLEVKSFANQIEIAGYDKQKVNMVASDLCKIRKYNPYKQKGVVRKGKFMLKKEANKKK